MLEPCAPIPHPSIWPVIFGIIADAFNLIGSITLAVDACLRLRDIHAIRAQESFQENNPGLRLRDRELALAATSVRRAIVGIILITTGFSIQLTIRILTAL